MNSSWEDEIWKDGSQFLMRQTGFSDFLSTVQSGSAHKTPGFTSGAFLAPLLASLLFCIIEVILFSVLRTRLPYVYQPKTIITTGAIDTDKCLRKLFSWIGFIRGQNLDDFYPLGLDTYFFMRYLVVMCRFFLFIGIVNNLILLPINYSSNYEGDNLVGFDQFSISNIPHLRASRYIVHFLLATFVIVHLQFIIQRELESFVKIKNEHLTNSGTARTLLVRNIPRPLIDSQDLVNQLDKLPFGIKSMHFLRDSVSLDKIILRFKKTRNQLEATEVNYLSELRKNLAKRNGTISRHRFFEGIEKPKIRLPVDVMGTSLQIPFFGKEVDAIDFYSDELASLYNQMQDTREKLINEQSSVLGIALIEFNEPIGAHILNQIALFDSQLADKNSEIISNSEDIAWGNVRQRNQRFQKAITWSVRILSILITLFWVIPVSAIGIIAQLPYLSKLFPILNWLDHLPIVLKDLVAGLIPTIALTCLTELVFWLFGTLSLFKGKITTLTRQMDLQKWLFLFLFFHVFLVVTISSGIIVIIESSVQNPISIPALLATDLPKASNFFHSFFIIRSFIYSGNTLIQPRALFWEVVRILSKPLTPRQNLKLWNYQREITWGSLNPTLTVFGCIGIVYSVISPLILVFCFFCFFLISTAYQYNLLCVYQTSPQTEMNGQLFPGAMLQLYAGIYCLELALIGLFMIQGRIFLATMMIMGFLLTISVNVNLKRKYFQRSLPLISIGESSKSRPASLIMVSERFPMKWIGTLIRKLDEIHPGLPTQRSNPSDKEDWKTVSETQSVSLPSLPELSIWLPEDTLELSPSEIRRFKAKSIEVSTQDMHLMVDE